MTTPTVDEASIRTDARLLRDVNPAEYDLIRQLFLYHYEHEQAGDIDGILETMSADCVYDVPQFGHQWHGHDGARVFYTALLSAFPDNQWSIDDIAIGPQGVLVVTTMHGRLARPFLQLNTVGKELSWRLVIMYPWDATARKFTGERVYFFNPEPAPEAQ